MDNKKLLLVIVLSIFIVGMVMGPAAASHTFKAGKYKCTVSDKQYKKLKKAKKNGDYYSVTKKTTKKYKVKVPKYKTVTKKKWKYKKVLQYKDVWNADWSDYTTYEYDIDKYWDNGWTWYGSVTKEEDGGHVYKYFSKFKKKIKYKTKVKTGYKKVSKKFTMEVSSDGEIWVYNPNGNVAKISTWY